MSLIVLEGIDGCGKTTVSKALVRLLLERTGLPWAWLPDPSSGPVGSLIRQFLSSGSPAELDALGYLFMADRLHQSLSWHSPHVVADRYLLSTWVYQRDFMPLPALLGCLSDHRLRVPDVVVFLDVEPHVCLSRILSRGAPDVFEQEARLTRICQQYRSEWLGRNEVNPPEVRRAVFGRHQVRLHLWPDLLPEEVAATVLESLEPHLAELAPLPPPPALP